MKKKIMKVMYWIAKEVVTNATLAYLGVLFQDMLYEGTDWFPSYSESWLLAVAIISVRITYYMNKYWKKIK